MKVKVELNGAAERGAFWKRTAVSANTAKRTGD
jgi:hypothetical protein